MFTAKQTRLMNTLGIVTDADRNNMYDAYGEVSCEMSCEGMNPGSFTAYLEHKVAVAAYLAKLDNKKAVEKTFDSFTNP